MKNFLRLLLILCCSFCLSANAFHTSETYAYDEDEEVVDKGYAETSDEFESEVEEKQEYDVDMRPYISFKYTSTKKTVNK